MFLVRCVVVLSILITSFFASDVYCQGNGGIHTIKGRVYLPNGSMLERSIKVELQSMSSPPQSVYTDGNGSFTFISINPGSYSVVVEAGDSFEVAREPVYIDKEVQMSRNSRIPAIPKTANVPVHLRLKPNEVLNNKVIDARLASLPKDALQHYERGLTLASAGKDEEAIKEFRSAVAISPRFALPYIEIGKIYIRLGKNDEAVTALRAAIGVDGTDFEANLNCGIALLNQRSLDDAAAAFSQAANIKQTAVTPHFYLGLVFVQKHDLENAQQKMEFARELAGLNEFPLIHKYLGGIYWQKAAGLSEEKAKRSLLKQAVTELEKYIKLLPTARDAKKIRETISELRTKLG